MPLEDCPAVDARSLRPVRLARLVRLHGMENGLFFDVAVFIFPANESTCWRTQPDAQAQRRNLWFGGRSFSELDCLAALRLEGQRAFQTRS
jgi:hypothetical protein